MHCDQTEHFSADISLWLDVLGIVKEKHAHVIPAVFFQFHVPGTEVGIWMCNFKLGVISQQRLKIEVKSFNCQSPINVCYGVFVNLLLTKSHICRVDWHNNG